MAYSLATTGGSQSLARTKHLQVSSIVKNLSVTNTPADEARRKKQFKKILKAHFEGAAADDDEEDDDVEFSSDEDEEEEEQIRADVVMGEEAPEIQMRMEEQQVLNIESDEEEADDEYRSQEEEEEER